MRQYAHFPWFSSNQTQFKSQGNKLVPDGVEEQALMYQRMFEGLTFYDKLCKMTKIIDLLKMLLQLASFLWISFSCRDLL